MIAIHPGELAQIRTHLAALEGLLQIVDRLSESAADAPIEDGELEGAIERIYGGLEVLERRARRDLAISEESASRSTS